MYSEETRYCYSLIEEYYRGKRAKRSGVPYMNHINEGLVVLKHIRASDLACAAYCIHPIVQDDDSLQDNMRKVSSVRWDVLLTAMEYRNVANRGLSCYQVDNPESIYLGPLPDVWNMLIADKVQNRKDFLVYHFGTHPKSIELDRYFRNWLRALEVTEQIYERLCKVIQTTKFETPSQEFQRLNEQLAFIEGE